VAVAVGVDAGLDAEGAVVGDGTGDEEQPASARIKTPIKIIDVTRVKSFFTFSFPPLILIPVIYQYFQITDFLFYRRS